MVIDKELEQFINDALFGKQPDPVHAKELADSIKSGERADHHE